MRSILFVLLFSIVAACGVTAEAPGDPLDSGRQFIDAIFKGNFKRAKQLMLEDKVNLELLDEKLAQDFRQRDGLDKEQLRTASIVINQVENVSDSVTIINFLNSYDGKPAVLKVVYVDGKWLTDLKYTFSGNF